MVVGTEYYGQGTICVPYIGKKQITDISIAVDKICAIIPRKELRHSYEDCFKDGKRYIYEIQTENRTYIVFSIHPWQTFLNNVYTQVDDEDDEEVEEEEEEEEEEEDSDYTAEEEEAKGEEN